MAADGGVTFRALKLSDDAAVRSICRTVYGGFDIVPIMYKSRSLCSALPTLYAIYILHKLNRDSLHDQPVAACCSSSTLFDPLTFLVPRVDRA